MTTPGDKDVITHLIDPVTMQELVAAGLGSFLFLMFTRKPGWLHVLAVFFVGEVTAYYFTPWLAMWLGWTMNTYGAVAFTIGVLGMLFWGGAISLVQKFHDDPAGMVSWALRLFRGGSGTPGDGGKGS